MPAFLLVQVALPRVNSSTNLAICLATCRVHSPPTASRSDVVKAQQRITSQQEEKALNLALALIVSFGAPKRLDVGFCTRAQRHFLFTQRMATRRIKQSTFDDAVKENMEEFGLEREEAEVDAVKQFEASGIDLSNIVTRGGDTHPVLAAVRVLSTATSPLPESAPDASSSVAMPESAAVAEALAGLEMELQRDAAATRAVAGSNDAIKYLTLLVAASCGHTPVALRDAAPLLQQALRVLRLLCSEHPDNRALVAVGFARVLVELGSAPIPGLDAGEEAAGARSPSATLAVQCSALQLAGLLCVKREGWKVAAYRLAAPRTVARHVDAAVAAARAAPLAAAAGSEAGAGASGDAPSPSPAGLAEHAQRVAAGCALLSRMLTDDDLSVEASKVYDHARAIAGSAPGGGASAASSAESGVDELAGLGLVGKLLDLLQAYRHDV